MSRVRAPNQKHRSEKTWLGMSTFQWAMILLTAAGFAVTLGAVLVSVTRAVESIKLDTSKKIAAEVVARTAAISKVAEERAAAIDALRKEFEASQKAQDHIVGEMGAALRRFIETVEKEMHEIEIWGRDHYVQKPEFDRAIETIRTDIRGMGAEIKSDLRALDGKIEAARTQS